MNISKVIEPTSEPVPLNSTVYVSAGKLLEVDFLSNSSDGQNEFQLQYRAGILYTKLLTFRANYSAFALSLERIILILIGLLHLYRSNQ